MEMINSKALFSGAEFIEAPFMAAWDQRRERESATQTRRSFRFLRRVKMEIQKLKE